MMRSVAIALVLLGAPAGAQVCTDAIPIFPSGTCPAGGNCSTIPSLIQDTEWNSLAEGTAELCVEIDSHEADAAAHHTATTAFTPDADPGVDHSGYVGGLPLTGGVMTGPIDLTPQTSPAHIEGRLYYNAEDFSLTYHNDESEVEINVGRETLIRVRNNSGATIVNGSAVRVTGSSGQRPTIACAQADTTTNARAVGLVTHDVENNTNGYVAVLGQVGDLNTSAYQEGDVLYLSEAVACGLTTTGPDLPIRIGVVLNAHVNQGLVAVGVRDRLSEAIPDDLVTNEKLSDMAQNTIKLRSAAGSGNPEDVSIGDLTEEASPDSGDLLMAQDGATGDLRKIDIANLPAATAIDADGDGTEEVYVSGTDINFDPDDDAVREGWISGDGRLHGHSLQSTGSSITFFESGGTKRGEFNSTNLEVILSTGSMKMHNTAGIWTDTDDQYPIFNSTNRGKELHVVPFYAVQSGGTDVNRVTATSSAAGSSPSLAATGTDTNLDLVLTGKGSGCVTINSATICGAQAGPPSGPGAGSMYTDNSAAATLCWYDGSAWNVISGGGSCA